MSTIRGWEEFPGCLTLVNSVQPEIGIFSSLYGGTLLCGRNWKSRTGPILFQRFTSGDYLDKRDCGIKVWKSVEIHGKRVPFFDGK